MKQTRTYTRHLVLAMCFAVGTGMAAHASERIDAEPQVIQEPTNSDVNSIQTGVELKAFGWAQEGSERAPSDQVEEVETLSSIEEFVEEAPELVVESSAPDVESDQDTAMAFPLETVNSEDDTEALEADPIAEIDEQVAAASSGHPEQSLESNPISTSSDSQERDALPAVADGVLAVVPVTVNSLPATPNAETPLPPNVDVSANLDR